jgi:phage terminase large subunit-like protein
MSDQAQIDLDLLDANDKLPGDVADLRELVELGAINGQLFGETFFPKTFRMKSPPFAQEVWDALDSTNRLVSLQLFRGAFKTTTCRVFAARRIAYAQARTILWIGISQDKAIESVRWFRKQVEFNQFYAQTFKLRPGSKWQDIQCEVFHGVDEIPITILAYGITGPIRGINIDDYRPDLILLDDIVNEEIGASPLQLQNVENLVYGAILQSLSPATETPDAKMVLLQTPIARNDVSMKSLTDPEWRAVRIPCWTKETEDEALEHRVSAWPERFPSETLRQQKRYAIQRNNVSTFSREMELKIVAPETATFLGEWLRYYDLEPDDHFYSVMVIDPVPPPSDAELAKGLKDKDYEVLTVVTRVKDKFYLREYSAKHGHDPSWTISEFFRLALKYRPRRIYVESVAYQRTLAWLLRKAMETQRQYFVIEEVVDKRKKFQRIVDGLSGPASNFKLFVKPKEHSEFIQQFLEYPSVAHDDIIETVAIAVEKLQGPQFSNQSAESWGALMDGDEEDEMPRLINRNLAP